MTPIGAASRDCSLAEFIVRIAEALGCRQSFSVVGGMSMYLNHAFHQSELVTVSYLHHETACIAAADGYSRAGDERTIGLATITSGPGVTNAITGIMSAYGDSTPVLIVAGQIKTADIDRLGLRTHGIQEVPSIDLVRPIVKSAHSLRPPHYIRQLREAVKDLTTPRLGPVFVEVPLDVQSLVVPNPDEALREVVQDAAANPRASGSNTALPKVLREPPAKPLFVIGNGARYAARWPAFLDVLEAQRVPRAFTWLSFDMEPADDALNVGCPGMLAPMSANRILQAADLVVCVGARLDLATTGYAPSRYGTAGRRIIVDIDEAELSKFHGHPGTETLALDADVFMEAMIPHLETWTNHDEWSSWVVQESRIYREEEVRRLYTEDLTEYSVASILSGCCEETTVVLASSGVAEERVTRFLRPKVGTRIFNGAALGSMGIGLGQGIGAALRASSDRRVWIVEADGGLWMQAYGLASLRSLRGRTTLFILNNGGYGSIRRSQGRNFGAEFGTGTGAGLEMPNYEAVCSALGLAYHAVRSIDELQTVVDRDAEVTAPRPPIVVELFLAENNLQGPSVGTVIRDGVPSTDNLEEIRW